MRLESPRGSEAIALGRPAPHGEGSAHPPLRDALTPRWYAIRTRARHEKKVRDEIEGRRIEVFLPTYARWSQWKDRRMRVEFPLFPGYCFARFPLAERLRVLTVYGVIEVIGVKGQLEPLPDGEIEAIQRLVAGRFDYDPHPFLTEGMEVEVVRGPLKGVRGRLIRKDRMTRLVLAVTLIHQAAAVEIHPADVVAV